MGKEVGYLAVLCYGDNYSWPTRQLRQVVRVLADPFLVMYTALAFLKPLLAIFFIRDLQDIEPLEAVVILHHAYSAHALRHISFDNASERAGHAP